MSGEKRRQVRIDEAELRRLREQESRLRTVQKDLPEQLNRVREQTRQEMQQRLRTTEQRAQTQAQEAQRLRSNLAQIEQETQRRLNQQRQEFQTAIKDVEARQKQAREREVQRLNTTMQQNFAQQRSEYLRIASEQKQEYTQLIAQQGQKFTQLIAEEQQARKQGELLLQQQINEIVNDIEKQSQYAKDYLADVEAIWESINRDYQHERFTPGRLANLRRDLDLVRSNINEGLSQAAIATAQKTYLALVDLRIELEQKEQEWQLLYNSALEDLRSLIAEVQANRECIVEVDRDSKAESFKLEVDYWTHGSLSQYHKELDLLESELIQGESTLTTEQLKTLGEKITNLEPKLVEIVQQARLSILGSQMRAEIADQVVEALESLGYTLVDPAKDSVYEYNDQRSAYAVKVKNTNGDEIVTVISPEKELGVNSVSINTFSQTLIDEKAVRANAKAIFDALNENGVKATGEIVSSEKPQQKYYDLQKFGSPQTASDTSTTSSTNL
ncbi:MAG: hypothetical protein SAK29_08450 [Scytonema sp. PMC 1069.18]|nr:hypothetical protein [Scytonema sp. PMC 1069.18]MEC4880171.1 hypothetical protein [Scytonema sp. PMC 1070.18]